MQLGSMTNNMRDPYFIKPGYRCNPLINTTVEQEPKDYWDAGRVAISATYQYHAYKIVQTALQSMSSPSVVDVGCGPGIKLAEMLLPFAKRTVGIDQVTVVPANQRRYPAVEFYPDNFDAPTLDLAKHNLANAFDIVISADVVEHLPDPDCLLNYMRKFGHAETLYVISTPERDRIRGKRCMYSPNPQHIREWNAREFRQYLEDREFEIEDQVMVPEQKLALDPKHPLRTLLSVVRRVQGPSCQVAICKSRMRTAGTAQLE